MSAPTKPVDTLPCRRRVAVGQFPVIEVMLAFDEEADIGDAFVSVTTTDPDVVVYVA